MIACWTHSDQDPEGDSGDALVEAMGGDSRVDDESSAKGIAQSVSQGAEVSGVPSRNSLSKLDLECDHAPVGQISD